MLKHAMTIKAEPVWFRKFQVLLSWDYYYQITESYNPQKTVKRLLSEGYFKGKDLITVIESLSKLSHTISSLHKSNLTLGRIVPENIVIDENMRFKIHVIDSLWHDESLFEKDTADLIRLTDQILNQAGSGTVFEHTINRFCSIWASNSRSFISAKDSSLRFVNSLDKLKKMVSVVEFTRVNSKPITKPQSTNKKLLSLIFSAAA